MYTSATLSLAVLEALVHVDAATLPDDYIALPAELPDDPEIEERATKDLPPAWREPVDRDSLQAIGAAWIRAGETAVLAVPSAVVPEECNFLLNPAHEDFRRIRPGRARPFAFDARLIGLQNP